MALFSPSEREAWNDLLPLVEQAIDIDIRRQQGETVELAEATWPYTGVFRDF